MGPSASSGGAAVLTMGTFVAFNAAFGNFMMGVDSLSETAVDIIDSFCKAGNRQTNHHGKFELDTSKEDPGQLNGEIDVRDLSFRYSDDGPYILRDLSLKVHAETLLHLLARLAVENQRYSVFYLDLSKLKRVPYCSIIKISVG